MDAAIRVYRRNGFDPSSSRAPLLGIGGIVVLERAVPPTRRCADGDER
jgi:hypothetical protein